MKKQISSFSVFQTSKVFGLLYFVLSAIIAIPMGLFQLYHHNTEAAIGMFFAPFLYLLFAFIGMVLMTWLYNHIVKWVGGIEVTVAEPKDRIEN